jgi:hypothetical protein
MRWFSISRGIKSAGRPCREYAKRGVRKAWGSASIEWIFPAGMLPESAWQQHRFGLRCHDQVRRKERWLMTPEGLILGTRLTAIAAAAIAALALSLAGAQKALVVATAILAALIGVHLLLDRLWLRLPGMMTGPDQVADADAALAADATRDGTSTDPASAPSIEDTRDWGGPFKDGANLVITVEGVVLGLVFAFIGSNGGNVMVNVGAVSLAAGVVLGILLYSLAAGGIPSDWGAAIASLVLNISLYALAYGLICIVGVLLTKSAKA